MVIGYWLVRRGMSGDNALAEVARLFGTTSLTKVARHAASGSPQTEAQRRVVAEWAPHDDVLTGRAAATR